jgi:LysR family transcriptional regulator, nitrogen assimilation regulatory protein
MSAVATSERAREFVAWPIAARELVTRLSIAVSARRASTHTQKAVLELLAELAGGSRPWHPPGRNGIASRANSP